MPERPSRFQEFREQLYKKIKEANDEDSITCPMCQQQFWETAGGDTVTDAKVWPNYSAPVELNAQPHLQSIPIICKTCGFIAHFATSTFEFSEDLE